KLGIGREGAPSSVAVGPAVVGALANQGEKVRRGAAVAPIPLVDRRPQRARRRVEREPDGIPESSRDEALVRSVKSVTDERGAAAITLATNIVRRGDRDVEPAVWAEGDRPCAVVSARRKAAAERDRVSSTAGGCVG